MTTHLRDCVDLYADDPEVSDVDYRKLIVDAAERDADLDRLDIEVLGEALTRRLGLNPEPDSTRRMAEGLLSVLLPMVSQAEALGHGIVALTLLDDKRALEIAQLDRRLTELESRVGP